MVNERWGEHAWGTKVNYRHVTISSMDQVANYGPKWAVLPASEPGKAWLLNKAVGPYKAPMLRWDTLPVRLKLYTKPSTGSMIATIPKLFKKRTSVDKQNCSWFQIIGHCKKTAEKPGLNYPNIPVNSTQGARFEQGHISTWGRQHMVESPSWNLYGKKATDLQYT